MGGDKENRDALFDGLERLSTMVQEYTLIEDVYLIRSQYANISSSEAAIVKLYEQILHFEARAACQCSHNILSQTFRNLFAGNTWKERLADIEIADAECKKILHTLGHQFLSRVALQSLAISSQQLYTMQESVSTSENALQALSDGNEKPRQEQREYRDRKEAQQCLAKLDVVDYAHYKRQIPQRHHNTCKWFLNDATYLYWLETDVSILLWLTADPGCGKSVLARSLVDNFMDIVGTTAHVCYFFFKVGIGATGALASLLHQIFIKNPNLLRRHGLPGYHRGVDSFGSRLELLWETFVAVCQDPDREDIICILDALDECDALDREILAVRLNELVAHHLGVHHVKILITCRPNECIVKVATDIDVDKTVLFLDLRGETANLLTEEINIAIEDKLQRFANKRRQQGAKDDVVQEIRSKVTSTRNRTYLRISLVFVELDSRCSWRRTKLLKVFQEIPTTLNQTYQAILDRISAENFEDTRTILSIVLAAKRELRLEELVIASSMQRDGCFDSLDKGDGANARLYEEWFSNVCGSLIHVYDGCVTFLHRTVRDFLLTVSDAGSSDTNPRKYRFTNVSINRIMAQSCIWYLRAPPFHEEWVKDTQTPIWRLKSGRSTLWRPC